MIIKVNDLNLPKLEIYDSHKETPLKSIYWPRPGIFIAETANVILQALQAGYEAESVLIEEKYLENPGVYTDDLSGNPKRLAEAILRLVGDVPVYSASLDVISRINGFKQTRGILCAMRRKVLPPLSMVLEGHQRIAILEDVENPTNVGAIFRSGVGLGIEGFVLSYRSSDPLYRRSARVSMGSVFRVPWTFAGNKFGGWPDEGLQQIKNAGYKIVSMALADRAVSLDDPVLKTEEKLAIVFGNEENGISERTLQLSDYIVKIPMMNGVDSLNVAAASAVTFWELKK